MKFYGIHGFLGTPHDWQLVDSKIIALDPFEIKTPCPLGMKGWAKQFNKSFSVQLPSILIGYSLGARLAMHALLENEDRWKGAVLVSGHPGLTSKEEREKRIESDLVWAKKFEEMAWENVMDEWNNQSTFAGDVILDRKERDYSRSCLSDCLRYWSLGRQENLFDGISKIEIPILWVVGERDEKLVAIAKEMRFVHPLSQILIVSGAGHRVPWNDSELFKETINNFKHRITLECG